jgi:hypothetical protein
LVVVAELHGPSAVARLDQLASTLGAKAGVAAVLPPVLNGVHSTA